VPIPPRWREGTARIFPFPNGENGSSAFVVGATIRSHAQPIAGGLRGSVATILIRRGLTTESVSQTRLPAKLRPSYLPQSMSRRMWYTSVLHIRLGR